MVVESRHVLDEVVAEFEASCAGRLGLLAYRTSVKGGALECCGSNADPTRWTVAFVRKDRAVLPLTAGERDRVLFEHDRLQRAGTPIWNPDKFPLPRVIVDGMAYHFAPGHGRVLIGQVRLGRRAVLLAAIGNTLAVIHVAGRTRSVLHVGKPHSFRELDVDQLLRLQGRRGPKSQRSETTGPVRPPPSIEAEHHRIVRGLAVEVGTGPTIAQVLGACFEDVAARARALKGAATRSTGKLEATADPPFRDSAARRVRGKLWVRPVVRYLCKLAVRGHGNLVGRIGEILAVLREHFPDFTITAEALSDVLGLLRTLGTCLVKRGDRSRIWEINLAGLTDPRSALHRQLCRETQGRHVVGAAATGTVGGTEKPTEAEVVQAPLDVSPDHEDVKAILEELSRLPPDAGSDLLASTLKPASRAAASDSGGLGDDACRRAGGDLDVASPGATAPALERHQVDAPDLVTAAPAPASAAKRGHLGNDMVPRDVSTPKGAPGLDGEDVKVVLDELRQLPPEAAHTLLLGSCVYRKRLETAVTHEGTDDATTIADPRAPRTPPARLGELRPRGLHLSPDTLLLPRVAVVAEVPSAARSPGDGPRQDAVLGPALPVGEGPPGARRPPRGVT
jgi:hypothetical protein